MDWENLLGKAYNKASEGLENFRESNVRLQEEYSRKSDDQLIGEFKRGYRGAMR